MKQRTLAMANGLERYSKKTRRAEFTWRRMEHGGAMEKVVRANPSRTIRKAGNGRPPVGMERMLRMYFLQQWFNPFPTRQWKRSAVRLSEVMRDFVGIDLGRRTSAGRGQRVCKFRHLLEEHRLGGEMLETVNLHLEDKGVRITTGTIVDATIIHAPSSTKNREQKRDPEMHQTKKGNQWYFGMKAHVGVDKADARS